MPLVASFIAVLLGTIVTSTSATTLDNVSFSKLTNNRVEIRLTLSEPVSKPLSFAIDEPARIALDFPDVTLNLPSKSQSVGVGMARSVSAVEAAGRTRVVVNLIQLVPYSIECNGADITVTLESAGSSSTTALVPSESIDGDSARAISNIDFRRGESGESRLIVSQTDPNTVIDTREEGASIIVDFQSTSVPSNFIISIGSPTPIKGLPT